MRKAQNNIKKGSFGLVLTRKTLGNLSGGAQSIKGYSRAVTMGTSCITISIACDYLRPTGSLVTSASLCTDF